MNKIGRHRVKSFHWIDGVLSHENRYFESFEEAVSYSSKVVCDVIKIYDEFEQVIYTGKSVNSELYA